MEYVRAANQFLDGFLVDSVVQGVADSLVLAHQWIALGFANVLTGVVLITTLVVAQSLGSIDAAVPGVDPDYGRFRTETILQAGCFQLFPGVQVDGGNVGCAAEQGRLAGGCLGDQVDFQFIERIRPNGQDEVVGALGVDNLLTGTEFGQVEGAGCARIWVGDKAIGARLVVVAQALEVGT